MDLPKGWLLLGRLPHKEPDDMDEVEAFATLRNEILAVGTPRLEYIISIMWIPDYKGQTNPRPGKYLCRLIKDRDWSQPEQEWRFPKTAQVAEWLHERLVYLKRRFAKST